jgi:hypothetical protein
MRHPGEKRSGKFGVVVQLRGIKLVRWAPTKLARVGGAASHEGRLGCGAGKPLHLWVLAHAFLGLDLVVGVRLERGVSEVLVGAVAVGCLAWVERAATDKLDRLAVADVKGAAIGAVDAEVVDDLLCRSDHLVVMAGVVTWSVSVSLFLVIF